MAEIVPFQRSFPWEILVLIFEVSDDSALAALGGVSLDVLETVAPLLYRTARITSVEQLELLFCERDEETKSATPSRINHLLDFSQIHNLNLDFTYIPYLLSLRLFFSRKSISSDTIPLDSLRVSLNYACGDILRLLHFLLFPQLNPIVFEYHVKQRRAGRDLGTWDTPAFDLGEEAVLLEFNRPETLVLKGMIPFRPDPTRLAALHSPSLDRRRNVRLHLATLLYSHWTEQHLFIRDIGRWVSILGLRTMQDGAVVLVVRTKEEGREAKEAVEKLDEMWRSKFSVEVEV